MEAVDQAVILLDAGQTTKARALLRSALAQSPTDGRAHLLMARAEALGGDLAAGERHARSAAADPDTRAAALELLARILGFDRTRVREAVEAASAAVQADPQNWSHRAALALALSDARDVANATAQAEAAVQLAPADPVERSRALMSLARVFLADPAHRERGYRVMRDAAALDPTDPALQQQVMIAQFQSGRRAEAVRTALESLRVTPTAAVPPLLARLSVYFVLRRLLWWCLLVTFAVPLVFIGILSNIVDAPDALVRAAAATGLVALAGTVALTLRPLRDAATRRAVWRFARRRVPTWIAAVALALSMLGYAVALVLGEAAFAGVTLPLALVLVAVLAHALGAFGLRVPSAASMLAAQSR